MSDYKYKSGMINNYFSHNHKRYEQKLFLFVYCVILRVLCVPVFWSTKNTKNHGGHKGISSDSHFPAEKCGWEVHRKADFQMRIYRVCQKEIKKEILL